MKIIRNRYLPPKGFAAINLFGVVFTRRVRLSNKTIRHEAIHTAQMRELRYVGFYVWYGVEWLFRLAQLCHAKRAYRNISFEREARANDRNESYLIDRKRFSFFKYIRNG